MHSYVYACVCVCVCMYVGMHAFLNVCMDGGIYGSMDIQTCVRMDGPMKLYLCSSDYIW